MAISINSNYAASLSTALLNKSSNAQEKLIQQLASGLSINNASDNAAGLAVSTNMTTQIDEYSVGMQNSNDGISLLQTADGGAANISDMLQTQRDLALQSMNGTYNAADRSAMNEQFNQLTAEIDRVANTTSFNGINLLSNQNASGTPQAGNPAPISIQTTANSSQSIDLANFSTSTTGGVFGGTPYNSNNIATDTAAATTVTAIDSALSNISTTRANWGAEQNRLDSTVNNLSTTQVNLSAARSQIQDTDYAKTVAALVNQQTYQQVGIAMLAQRNANSSQVMSLLK
ncbi:MAG: flagellin FliC [Proteobacteria bacterium]|nr:flagellin FliC [Pseudomonadota bacterium]